MNRGQASITAIEAVIGVLLLMSVTLAFAVGMPGGEDAKTEAQLELYADDAATLLTNEPPRHGDLTRVTEITRSEGAFDRERDALEQRIDRILPDNLMYRLETEYGAVGYPLPADVQTGEATILTPHGEVTLRVWYV